MSSITISLASFTIADNLDVSVKRQMNFFEFFVSFFHISCNFFTLSKFKTLYASQDLKLIDYLHAYF